MKTMCRSKLKIEYSPTISEPETPELSKCYLAHDHLGSHEGFAHGKIWWWNQHGHGIKKVLPYFGLSVPKSTSIFLHSFFVFSHLDAYGIVLGCLRSL